MNIERETLFIRGVCCVGVGVVGCPLNVYNKILPRILQQLFIFRLLFKKKRKKIKGEGITFHVYILPFSLYRTTGDNP